MHTPVQKTFIALLFISIFLMTLRPVEDPDFWWHLRTGQLIASTGTIPHADPFSFTFAGKPWTAHEWLSELLLFSLYQIGGFPILIIVFSFFITTAFLILYLRSTANVYISGFILLLGAISTAPVWGVRPQILTFLFSSLYLFLLEQYYENHDLKWILPLPILTILWVNLHAGYAMGLVIIAVYTFCHFLELIWHQLSGSEEKLRSRELIPPVIIFGASLLAVMLNPNGPRMYIYPFETLTSPSMQQFIQEWFSPDFHQKEWQPFALLLISMPVIAIFGRGAKIKLARVALVFLFGYMALRSMRNIPLFILSAVPVMIDLANAALQSTKQAFSSKLSPGYTPPPAMPRILHMIVIACAILLAAGRFVMVTEEQASTEKEKFPSAAVDWIMANRPPGNIYNTYGWGGYLIWRLPDYPVYIDGRADLYGDRFIETYIQIYNAQSGWEENLVNNNVNLVLVENGSGIGNALEQISGWELVFYDESAKLFRRK